MPEELLAMIVVDIAVFTNNRSDFTAYRLGNQNVALSAGNTS